MREKLTNTTPAQKTPGFWSRRPVFTQLIQREGCSVTDLAYSGRIGMRMPKPSRSTRTVMNTASWARLEGLIMRLLGRRTPGHGIPAGRAPFKPT